MATVTARLPGNDLELGSGRHEMKHWLPIILGILLGACGGGDDDDAVDNVNIGWVDIREPINGNGTYRTRESSIEISGNAFVSPADADCETVNPVQLTLTWDNDSSGQSGGGGIRSFCQDTFLGFQRVSRWLILAGDIDLQFGDNVINIRAADNAGNFGTATINVIREEDVTAPLIVDASPGPGTIDAPVNRSITVTFSESMRATSLTNDRFTVTDTNGQTVTGFTRYDDRNFRWEFDPEFDLLHSTDYRVTISGLVEDRFGNNTMGADVSWSFTTAPNTDVTPPAVTEVSPDPGAACVSPDANVLASFDEPLDSMTVNSTTFTLTETGGAAIDATVTYDGTTTVLDPPLPLISGITYEARLTTGIADLAGNALGADFSWSFTTASTVVSGNWSQTSQAAAPVERRDHSMVWSGSEIIVWGGHVGAFAETDTGGRYDPVTDTWSAMSREGVPARSGHTAIMAGNEMFVWGGNTNTGFRYDPGTDTWMAMSTINAPSSRRLNVAIWTGTEMLVWGGASPADQALDTGGRYDPMTDTWNPMSTENAPSPRVGMAYAWTGAELIVWGGVDSTVAGTTLTDGARYNPVTDTWTPMAIGDATGGPELVAAWNGYEMVVWNGGLPSFIDGNGYPAKTATLRMYDPLTDSWRATANLCEPYLGAGEVHAHWTGSRLFVWSNDENGGYFYDPASDSWDAIDSFGGPSARSGAASAWTGGRFVLWGGQAPSGLQETGFVFTE